LTITYCTVSYSIDVHPRDDLLLQNCSTLSDLQANWENSVLIVNISQKCCLCHLQFKHASFYILVYTNDNLTGYFSFLKTEQRFVSRHLRQGLFSQIKINSFLLTVMSVSYQIFKKKMVSFERYDTKKKFLRIIFLLVFAQWITYDLKILLKINLFFYLINSVLSTVKSFFNVTLSKHSGCIELLILSHAAGKVIWQSNPWKIIPNNRLINFIENTKKDSFFIKELTRK
jgi:hypothetical protein